MSDQGSGRKCIFCGIRKADSKEHTLPSWVRKYVADGDEPFNHWEVDNATRETIRAWAADGPDFKARRVCQAHCNGGWMNDLEGEVQRFLPGLIQGHRKTLHREGQRVVAFWAIKTAITWQYASRGQPIPAHEARRLYAVRESRTPPPGWQVWIGATDSLDVNGYHCPAKIELELSNRGYARGYASTFAIGHVALQVFGSELGDRAEGSFREESAIKAVLLPIWPYVEPVNLPPPAVLDLQALEWVARAFVS